MFNLNGKLLPEKQATVTLQNRAMNYGDAVFETIRFSGGKLHFWEDHYFRLMASMRILRMEIPMAFTMEFLENEILRSLEPAHNDEVSFRVKLLVWRQDGGRYCPLTHEVHYAITSEKLDSLNAPFANLPYVVDLYKDHFIAADLLSTLKTNNRLINILGSIFAKENNLQNCLLLNERKQVVEALNGNLFLVFGNVIKTPPLSDGCLNGIIRKQVFAILKTDPNYTLEEASISPFELQKADEMFLTNSIEGIKPVFRYRKKEYGNETAKYLSKELEERANRF